MNQAIQFIDRVEYKAQDKLLVFYASSPLFNAARGVIQPLLNERIATLNIAGERSGSAAVAMDTPNSPIGRYIRRKA